MVLEYFDVDQKKVLKIRISIYVEDNKAYYVPGDDCWLFSSKGLCYSLDKKRLLRITPLIEILYT